VACTTRPTLRLGLDLDRELPPDWLVESRARAAAGDADAAIAVLDRVPAADRVPALLSRRARLHARTGDWEASDRELAAAVDAHLHEGSRASAIRDLGMRVFHRLNRAGDLAGAHALLATAPDPMPVDAGSVLLLASTRGLAARVAADLPSSERHYRAALHIARRVGDSARIAAATSGLAQTLGELGRFDLALASLRALDRGTLGGFGTCDRARFHNARAWIQLLENESEVPGVDPLPDLDVAAALLAERCAHLDYDRANVEVNRALAFVQRGDTAAARRSLDAARVLQPRPPAPMRAWMLELDSRIALAEGDTDAALRGFEELVERGGASLQLETQWRGHLGAAQAERSRGGLEAALRHFGAADRLIRTQADALPVLGSRASFVARYEQLPRAWIEVLVQLGRTREAWMVARRYRNEPLRRIQQALEVAALDDAARTRWLELAGRYQRLRAALDDESAHDWMLAVPELAAVRARRADRFEALRGLVAEATRLRPAALDVPASPQPMADALDLLYFPGERAWLAFAQARGEVRAVRLGPLDLQADSDTLSAALLQPFRTELEHASHVRVMPYGPLRELDFHRLPFDGRPLAAYLPVVYSADIDEPARFPAVARRVAVFGDPRGDLPHARNEADAIAGLWRAVAGSGEVDVRVGVDVTRSAVIDALARADTWHFAGHTVPAGFAGERALALAGDQTFDAADVLLLARVPGTVVLASCEGARPDTTSAVDGMTMAHAFLARGGREVVASSRPVDDAAGAVVTNILHRLHAEGVPLERALAEAQARLREHDPSADWASFRLYTR
jgi:tetratricopeptide (TPR) repeat protein